LSDWEDTKNLNAEFTVNPEDLTEAIRMVAKKHGSRRRRDAQERHIESSVINYETIFSILRDPAKSPQEITEDVQGKLEFPVRSSDLIFRKMRSWNIAYSDHRGPWAERMNRTADLFWEFIFSSGKDAQEKREALRRAITDGRNERFKINFSAIVIALIARGGDVPWIGSLRETARILAPSSFRFLLWELVDVVALSKGLSVKRSVREEIENMQSFLRESLDSSRRKKTRDPLKSGGESSEGDFPEDPKEVLEQLEQDLEDFRAALECTQTQIEMLENRLEEVREEAARDATVTFFQEMNSERAGNLLDQFVLSGRGLKKLRRSGFVFPPEAESIPASVRMFLQFLEERRIMPLAEVGTQLRISLKDSEQYDYQGSDFADGEETKLVEVIRPGWEYQGVVISKPSVREQMESPGES
jgi:hypothetical protein